MNSAGGSKGTNASVRYWSIAEDLTCVPVGYSSFLHEMRNRFIVKCSRSVVSNDTFFKVWQRRLIMNIRHMCTSLGNSSWADLITVMRVCCVSNFPEQFLACAGL